MRILPIILLVFWSMSIFADEAPDFGFEDAHDKHAKSRVFTGLNNRTWVNNTVEWWYNPNNQTLPTEQVVQAITNATLAWQNISGVKFVYKGLTTQNLSNTPDGKFVIGWLDAQTFNKRFGNYAGYTAIWWLDNIIDGEVNLNLGDPNITRSITSLQALMTHELGHSIGLAHSNDTGSIMYAPYHSYEYQLTLRTDDVNAARSLYPCPGCGDWYRVLNWAESNYPALFSTSNKQSIEMTPNSTRYYPATQTYLGYNTVGNYFYSADTTQSNGHTTQYGGLQDYLNKAVQAGY